MKIEDYRKEEKIIESEIEAAKVKLTALQEKFKSEFFLKEGDKVLVTTRKWTLSETVYEKQVCFIGKTYFRYGNFKIDFNKMKKDGTMSGHSAGIYDYEKIEKLSA